MSDHGPTADGHEPDPVGDRLRRYADAAEVAVTPAAAAATGEPRRPRRAWYAVAGAAAAALVLLAGTTGVVVSQRRGGDEIESVPAERPPTDRPRRCLPAPSDVPTPEQMDVDLPYVGEGSEIRTTEQVHEGRVTLIEHTRTFDLGSGEVLTAVAATRGPTFSSTADLREPHGEPVPAQLSACGVERTDGTRPTTDGILSYAGGELVLTTMISPRHRLTLRAPIRSLTHEQLVAVAEALMWSSPAATAPFSEPTTTQGEQPRPTEPADPPCVVDDEEAPTIDGARVHHLPEGYEADGPVRRSVTDPAEPDSEGVAYQDFTASDGRTIRVGSFWSQDPPRYVLTAHEGRAAEPVEVARCNADDVPAAVPLRGYVSVSDDGVTVSVQDWGHGGLVVTGTGGATRDEVLRVASGLR